ncbi:uncharacterized protein LOC143556119 [Bidens hawaiensis]|uniref:uncharacterized protein LOC143556119 n=1 Tax=Bidens hawaiensis TaxID=980011 RepID=UPI00404B5E4A
MASGQLIKTTKVFNKGKISLAGYDIPIRLLPMSLAGFDIVIGMDWLSTNQVHIKCEQKSIDIQAPDNKTVRIAGDQNAGQISIISKIKANQCLGKGCLAFMVYVAKEFKPKKINEVPVVSEFQDVFPDEFPGIPPDREVEFKIELLPGTNPIAKAPYNLVLSK